jgi:hypothetical protein
MSIPSFCYLCGKPIKFDNEYISESTGKKIPLVQRLTSHIIVLCEVCVRNSSNHTNSNSNHYSSRSTNKGVIINVTKVAARKSILMQTTKARAANGFL